MLWKAKYSLLVNMKETIVWGKMWIKVLWHCRVFTLPTSFVLVCFFVLVLTLKTSYLFLLKLCCTHPYCFTMKQFKTKKDSNHSSEVLTSHSVCCQYFTHQNPDGNRLFPGEQNSTSPFTVDLQNNKGWKGHWEVSTACIEVD